MARIPIIGEYRSDTGVQLMRARVLKTTIVLFGFVMSGLATPLLAAPDSGIMGKITIGGSVQESGTVLAYHLATGEVFRGEIGPKGEFSIPGLESGYYDIAVETSDGLYVANQVVNAPPGGTASVKYELTSSVALGEGPRPFPGSDRQASGIAQLTSGGSKGGGGMSGKKVAIWGTAAGVAAVLLLSGGSSGGGSSSPSMPSSF
jgi:hypothetical protein